MPTSRGSPENKASLWRLVHFQANSSKSLAYIASVQNRKKERERKKARRKRKKKEDRCHYAGTIRCRNAWVFARYSLISPRFLTNVWFVPLARARATVRVFNSPTSLRWLRTLNSDPETRATGVALCLAFDNRSTRRLRYRVEEWKDARFWDARNCEQCAHSLVVSRTVNDFLAFLFFFTKTRTRWRL